ncbi:TMV resistance protein N-like protein [Tanacetum coccineum]
MACLRFTTNFDELPNLKGFMLDNCRLLEEIHPSIGYSKSLEFIEIETCYSLKIFPSITWSTKLNTVKILYCPNLVKVSKTQQGSPDMIQRELSPYSRNADIKSAVGVLPNLQELDLSGNMFSEVKTSGA